MTTIAPTNQPATSLAQSPRRTVNSGNYRAIQPAASPFPHFKKKALVVLLSMLPALAISQEPLVAGANINMVSGTEFPGGDPFLQRQNEPSLAVSTRNPLHLLGGANDYRTVDIPGLTDGKTVGDSWPGVYTSVNGGGSWVSTLIPGYPQDLTDAGLESPLKGYEAGADPVIRAGTNGLLYYGGIVFDRGNGAKSAAFVSRFMDLNNDPRMVSSFEDSPVRYIDTQLVDSDPGEANDSLSKGFIDKPWLAVDIPRSEVSQNVTLSVPQEGGTVLQNVDCGPLYMAYAQITGEDTSDIDSHVMFSSSYDCGETWSKKIELDGDDRSINQGTSVAINPNNGDVFVSWRQFNQATLQCTRGGDFWETNPGEWPVERFMLGGVLYDQQQALEIMAGSQNGNPWRLSRGMIVAKLNLLSGLNDKALARLVDDADAWLIDAEWVYEGSGNGPKNTKDKTNKGNDKGKGNAGDKEKTNSSLASELSAQIELFNEGEAGPGDCSTFPSGQDDTDKPDAIMMAYSRDFGVNFSAPIEVSKLVPFDQGTTLYTFRNNSYPTMAVDAEDRVYISWSTRNRTGEPTNPEWVDSRIVVASAVDGVGWSEPKAIDYDLSSPFRGHQIQPSLTFNNGKLMMVYLDFRQDRSAIFERYIADVPTDPPTFRHTVDVRVAASNPGSDLDFTDYSILNDGDIPSNPSTQLSRYFNLLVKYDDAAAASREQLQYNPLNQPLFKGGTVPFIGDYIDLAASPSFLPNGDGTWSYNTGTDTSPVFHAAWTDNRDVRGPIDGDWTKYVPPANPYSSGGTSIFDATTEVQECVPGVNDEYTGMRNQNIYTSRITQGLYVGIPANAKPLREDLPRSFVLFAKYSKNTLALGQQTERSFTLRILNQPEGGMAGFNQSAFSLGSNEAPVTEITVKIGRNSSIAKTIYATSTDPSARVEVEVVEDNGLLRGVALINPDPINPEPVYDEEEYAAKVKDSSEYFESNLFDTRLFESLEDGTLVLENELDRASSSPGSYDLLTQSLSQLALTNPELFNPGIYNPGIYNPGIYNPGIYNPGIYNPGIYNPGIYNPGIYNPGIYNPGIYNPGIYNPGIYNGTITDVNYTIENDGATTSAYDVNIALDEIPVDEDGEPLYSYQLIVSRFSTTPVPEACAITEVPVQEVLINNTDPDLLKKLLDPNSEDSFYLNAGESAVVTLRIIPNVQDENDPPPPPPVVEEISIAVVEVGVDEEDFVLGDTQPDVITVLSVNIAPLEITSQTLADARGGQDYEIDFAATGGAGLQEWIVVPGTFLPRGLALSATGKLAGTPLEGGTFDIAVRVTDDTAITQQVFPITISAPADLIIVDLSYSPAEPANIDAITLHALVSNQGDEPAEDSILEFTIVGDNQTSYQVQTAVPELQGVQSCEGEEICVTEFSILHPLPSSLAVGNYVITAVANFNSGIIESDESNNSQSLPFEVLQAPADLIINNLRYEPVSPSIGDQITVYADVYNAGDGTAGPSAVRFDLVSVSNSTVVETFTLPIVASLPPTGVVPNVHVFQAQLIAGDYRLDVWADSGNAVAESDEANNSAFATFTVDKVVEGALGTATIDAVLTTAEWGDAITFDVDVTLPGGTTAPGSVLAMNDADNIYLALRFAQASAEPSNSMSIEFDNDNSGSLSDNDDGIILNPSIGTIGDLFRSSDPALGCSGSLCSYKDEENGGTSDGAAAFANDGTNTIYEFSHPLDSGDSRDGSLAYGDIIGMTVSIRMIEAGGSWPAGFGDTNIPFGVIDYLVKQPPVPNDTAYLGNTGGAKKALVSCPAGQFAVGLAAVYEPRIAGLTIDDYVGNDYLYNSRVYTAALRCSFVDSNWDHTSAVSDSDFSDYWGSEFATSRLDYTCESGEIMVGVLGTRTYDMQGYRNPNTFEGLLCENRAGEVRVEEAGVVKGPSRFTFSPVAIETLQCASGTAVAALDVWAAAWMDRFRFSCDVPAEIE